MKDGNKILWFPIDWQDMLLLSPTHTPSHLAVKHIAIVSRLAWKTNQPFSQLDLYMDMDMVGFTHIERELMNDAPRILLFTV